MSKKNKTKRAEKRDQFIKANNKRSGSLKWIIPVAVIALVMVVGGGLWYSRSGSGAGTGTGASQAQPTTIQMTDIKNEVAGGEITVSLSDIRKKKLVYFEYKGSQTVPLLAYVGPSGKVITAISKCEPCNSTRFHIDGDTIVCNTCGTVWKLGTHEGISGGCTAYPPQIISNQVKGDKVLIGEDQVANWKPRV